MTKKSSNFITRAIPWERPELQNGNGFFFVCLKSPSGDFSAYSKYKSMRKIGQHSKPDNTKHMAAWDTVSKGICIRSTVMTVKMANKRFSSVRRWLTHLGEGYNDLFSPHYLLFLTFAGNLVRRNREKTILEVKLTIALPFPPSKVVRWRQRNLLDV